MENKSYNWFRDTDWFTEKVSIFFKNMNIKHSIYLQTFISISSRKSGEVTDVNREKIEEAPDNRGYATYYYNI
jgi:hypothetical protein